MMRKLIIGLILTISFNCSANAISANNFQNLLIVDHPLVQDRLSILRDQDTGIGFVRKGIAR